MPPKDTNITAIGDDGGGTALSLVLAGKGCQVTLWGNFAPYVASMEKKRENRKFLPGFRLPKKLRLTSDLSEAMAASRHVVLAVPSQYMRSVLKKIKYENLEKHSFISV